MEMNSLGEMIAKKRTEKGYSQEKLAELLGVSRQAVTKWECGQSRPSSENLISLGKILDVSVDELLERGTLSDKQEDAGGSRINLIFIAISLACNVIYPVVSGIAGRFEIGTMILLFVITVPCQLFVHLVFGNAARTKNFSMLAGYNSKVKYNVLEYAKAIQAIDMSHNSCATVYVALICVFGCVGTTQEWIIPGLLLLYVLTFVLDIFVVNYRYVDTMFVNEEDSKRAKSSLPIDAFFIMMIILEVAGDLFASAMRDIENNSPSMLGLSGIMFLGIIATLIGLAVEEHRIKKWTPGAGKYRPGVCGMICAVISVAIVVILFLSAC